MGRESRTPSCLQFKFLFSPSFPVDNLPGPGKPYWPGDFVTTASESDGHVGSEKLRVEPVGKTDRLGLTEELPRENGETQIREGIFGSLPHPTALPQKGKKVWLLETARATHWSPCLSST